MPLAVPFAGLARLWRCAVASHLVRVTMICAGFAALLATGFHSGRDFAGILQAVFAHGRLQQVEANPIGAAPRPDRVAPLATADAAGEFTVSRVGELLISSRNSDDCMLVFFNNRTGQMSDVGRAACGLLTEVGDPTRDRAEVLRRAFRK